MNVKTIVTIAIGIICLTVLLGCEDATFLPSSTSPGEPAQKIVEHPNTIEGAGIQRVTSSSVVGHASNRTLKPRELSLLVSQILGGGKHLVLGFQTKTLQSFEGKTFVVRYQQECGGRYEAEFIFGGVDFTEFQQGRGGFSIIRNLNNSVERWDAEDQDCGPPPPPPPPTCNPNLEECDPEPPCEEDCEPPCEDNNSEEDCDDDSSDDECKVSFLHRHNQFDLPIGRPSNECAVLGQIMGVPMIPGSPADGWVTKCGKFYEFTSFFFSGEFCHNEQEVSHRTPCVIVCEEGE